MMRRKNKKIKKSQARPKKEVKVSAEGIRKTKIRVIGIGGGGCSIVSEIASKMQKASFVAANTDIQALKASGRRALRFQFGASLTHGLGTGMNAELGKEAAVSEKEKIKKLLEGQDLCILVASLGGGTGSGAAQVFAKISKDLGNLTYGIFTLPFRFEGEKKVEIAQESLKKVKNHLNALTVIPNERVFQIIDKSTPLKQALSIINKNLADSLAGLIETLYTPGLINIDFADFRTIMEGQGRLVYLNTVEVQRKEGSLKDLIEKVLASPLYSYGIRGAKGVLFNISGEKNLSLSEVSQISRTVSELVNPEAKIIFGISQSQKHPDTIKTTLLAAGCGGKPFQPGDKKEEKKKKKRAVKKNRTQEKSSSKIVEKEKAAKPKRKRPKRRIKIKVVKEEATSQPEEKSPQAQQVSFEAGDSKIRKNALQIRQEIEEIEQEMVEKEQVWDTPAFLRKKLNRGRQ